MGTDAAMMVTAASAMPQMTRGIPSSISGSVSSEFWCLNGLEQGTNLREKSLESNSGIAEHLMNADAAALVQDAVRLIEDCGLGKRGTHNTPILIARATPSFSLVLIWRDMIIFQGRIARTKSMNPEYPVASQYGLRSSWAMRQRRGH
jgi:hypothetical protein